MVAEADANGIDWRLMPVIGYLESTGGLYACGGNPFGWTSCTVPVDTFEHAIQIAAVALSGGPYAGLDVDGKLCVWVGATGCAEYVANAQPLLSRLTP
jgi:hypothetical protein